MPTKCAEWEIECECEWDCEWWCVLVQFHVIPEWLRVFVLDSLHAMNISVVHLCPVHFLCWVFLCPLLCDPKSYLIHTSRSIFISHMALIRFATGCVELLIVVIITLSMAKMWMWHESGIDQQIWMSVLVSHFWCCAVQYKPHIRKHTINLHFNLLFIRSFIHTYICNIEILVSCKKRRRRRRE